MNETQQFINHLRGYGDVHMDADVQNDLLTAADEIKRLEGEVIEHCEDAMSDVCRPVVNTGGWICPTDWLWTGRKCGDKLVTLGTWEKQQGGGINSYWYRKLPTGGTDE